MRVAASWRTLSRSCLPCRRVEMNGRSASIGQMSRSRIRSKSKNRSEFLFLLLLLLLLLILLLLGREATLLAADSQKRDTNWPSFRGPGARGIAEGYGTPTTWDAENGKNMRWKTPIPGLGHSSP